MMKPHRGRIENWEKVEIGYPKDPDNPHLGYVITGRYLDHPRFYGRFGHTSLVVAHDEKTGEIETLNSRYTLVD